MYDENRNLVFQGTDWITSVLNVNTITEGICYINNNKK